ncbi:5-hydroxytryptamine receptor-like [Parasteatoda tepidariorum]|uniref:5-hydroxytryptamine receptor-like n=1 Tax=Parasteatoda tepidariorum TaxID=114398 RepID=UPI000A2BFDE3|nr:5-hydroxytryptamine receptor 2A-like [Parasteatoda tepidariorum]XP_042897984.1 5-hydroxytryptamine receptor 2A-like [Parasteatoda tepidariorum]
MERLISANFSDNFTDFMEFPMGNETLFPILYEDHVANLSRDSDISKHEMLLIYDNSTNSSEAYWFDGNLTNFSLPLGNFTNVKNDTSSSLSDMVKAVIITGLLSSTTMATIVGNLFVIFAILMDRNLQTVGNYLVLSLAVADLMVALLVMPMGAIYEVYQEWILGPVLCEIWTSADVLCCTASILHLVAIATDRYWAVTNVDYVRQRSSNKIGLMIFLVWAVGFLVSFAPILGWKDDNFLFRIEEEKRCLVSQNAAYQIFATCATFYVPLVVILILYWRIFQVARKRIRHKPGAKARAIQPSEKSMVHIVTHDTKSSPSTQMTETTTSATNGTTATIETITPATKNKKKPTRENMEAKRERKAAKTLAIITGVFVICWLPFFVTALLMAICPACEPNPYLFSFFLWLGYANSMLNPIIYTIFSPDFRSAFKRVLCGKKRGNMR